MKAFPILLLFAASCFSVEAQFHCQTDADCLNNGSCEQSESNKSYCQCASGFGGDDCSAVCLKDCLNGGSCRYHDDISHGSDQDGNTYCECTANFLGVKCEIPFILCPDNMHKCLHGGTCVAKADDPSSFGCDCLGTRTGDMCQYESKDDPRIPGFQCQTEADCLNDGLCMKDGSEGICQCSAGFGGEDCSATCLRNCQNGGTCRFHRDISHGSDQDGDTYCLCVGNFLGTNCEIPYTLCPGDVQCLHGGTCQRQANGAYGCTCPSPRTGNVCQYDSQDDPRIPTTEAQKSLLSEQDEKTLVKALAMTLGAIVVAGIVTLMAMQCYRGYADAIENTKNENDITEEESEANGASDEAVVAHRDVC